MSQSSPGPRAAASPVASCILSTAARNHASEEADTARCDGRKTAIPEELRGHLNSRAVMHARWRNSTCLQALGAACVAAAAGVGIASSPKTFSGLKRGAGSAIALYNATSHKRTPSSTLRLAHASLPTPSSENSAFPTLFKTQLPPIWAIFCLRASPACHRDSFAIPP